MSSQSPVTTQWRESTLPGVCKQFNELIPGLPLLYPPLLILPFTISDDMLESEKSSLVGRVHDLERRVLTQQDEIVCLRSTLADVLRRVNQLEGMGSDRPTLGGRTSSAPGTPARTNSISSSRASPTPQQPLGHTFSNGSYNGSSNSYNGNGETIRLRKPQPRPMSSSASPSGVGSKGNSIEAMLRRNTMGSSGALSSQRSRTSHHQSNGSLHSDTQSSSSVSPAPSPSPRPPQSASASSVGLGKRWSSTGDFNTQSPLTNR